MPRGPGKKSNYNLDYSRFNQVDGENEDRVEACVRPSEADPADAGGVPPMEELLRRMPPEMQEAYRMMAISRQTGDKAAEKRANELCMDAIKKGPPQVQQEFLKEMSRQMPDVAKQLTQGGPEPGRAGARDPGEIGDQISQLREQMQAGQEAARKQLEGLQKQQDELESMRNPEDVLKFLQREGVNEEDMQRFFSGDQVHLEKKVNAMLDKAVAPGEKGRLVNPEKAIQAAEELASIICPDGSGPAGAAAEQGAAQGSRADAKPSVTIPDYRLQYQKDAEGRYTAVELRCTLPGVADMSAITLDVSEGHLRLHTGAPAPGYAVNAGPFPVLIEPDGARAKWSKRKEELFVSVPAKG